MLWGKISRPAPRVSTLVPFILLVAVLIHYKNVRVVISVAELEAIELLTGNFPFTVATESQVVNIYICSPLTGEQFTIH